MGYVLGLCRDRYGYSHQPIRTVSPNLVTYNSFGDSVILDWLLSSFCPRAQSASKIIRGICCVELVSVFRVLVTGMHIKTPPTPNIMDENRQSCLVSVG